LTTTSKKKSPASWQPPSWDLADAYAMQRLYAGEATPDQQKRALKWILEKAAAMKEWGFRPEGHRETDIALGRAFVGFQIEKLIAVNLDHEKIRKT